MTAADNDIQVYHSISELPWLTFPHRLDGACMVVCSRGAVDAGVDVARRHIEAGDIMVLKPGHVITSIRESDDFGGFLISVSSDKLTSLFPNIRYLPVFTVRFNENPVIHLTDDEMRPLALIHRLLIDHLKRPDKPFHRHTLVSMCEVLFFHTLSLYSSRTDIDTHHSRREELLAGFMQLLEDNFRTERTVTFYADRLFVTPKHLSAVLKDIYGESTRQWIERRVIQEAKLLLRTTGLDVQEISSQLNFANPSFFGKYFKHLTGMSPRDYRNNPSAQ